MKKDDWKKLLSEGKSLVSEMSGDDMGDISGLKKYLKYKIKKAMNTWIIGQTIDGKYDVHLVVFAEPSEYGIDKGRISKLVMKPTSEKGWANPIANFDRGWDVKPKDGGIRKFIQNLNAALK